MKVLFGCLAGFLGAISISLAARYGYKGADTVVDGVISAVVFGSTALCAFIFDAAAVRLWFMRHRFGAVVIGAISAAALVVTFTNSLGAIAGRADTTQAERARAKDDVAADRAELKRIAAERANLPAFTPADDDSVRAFEAAVDAAERARTAECDRRGPRCRYRETEEAAKRDALTTALTNTALAERAAKLDHEAATVRARLAKAPAVQNPNPLGAALELLIGAGALALTAWQQAVVAAVFELCLVGVMVIYELLRQEPSKTEANAIATHGMAEAIQPRSNAALLVLPTKPKPTGSVKTFVREQVAPADGHRIEMKALARDYRTWCGEKGFVPLKLNPFLDEIETLCRQLGIQIAVEDGQRVYCLNVKLDPISGGSIAAIH